LGTIEQHLANIRERKNEKASIVSTQIKPCLDGGKTAKPIEITEIIEGAQCTAAYIAQLTGELATLANGARFANLALLLARAQLEAELWSCQGN
jgi:hypothetical protein